MTARSLLKLAIEQYNVQGVESGELGLVSKQAKIPERWSWSASHWQKGARSTLILMPPGQLGLFAPDVLKGKGAGGGLESLEQDSKTKLACLIPVDELSVEDTLELPRHPLIALLSYTTPNPGSVVTLQHRSGEAFMIGSSSLTFAARLMKHVSGFFEVRAGPVRDDYWFSPPSA